MNEGARSERLPGKTETWLQRNWKWFLPVGCLGSILLFVALIGFIVLVVFGAMRRSEVYQEALGMARGHAEVVEWIGEPVTGGRFVTGSISVSGGSGVADLAIPVSGPEGRGTMYAEAEKEAGRWSFTRLVFEERETERRIDLLDAESGEEVDEEGEEGSERVGALRFEEVYYAREGEELTKVPNTFAAGEEFLLVFRSVGPFEADAEGMSHMDAGLVVLSPKLQRVIEDPSLFGEEGRIRLGDGFAQSITVMVSTDADMEPGVYTLMVILHDLLGERRVVRNTVFTLE